MIKRIAVFFILLYAGFWCIQQAPTHAAGWLPLAAGSGCSATLAQDGTPQSGNSAGTASLALTALSGLTAGDIIIVTEMGNGGPMLAPTDSAGSIWTLIGNDPGSGSGPIAAYWAFLTGTSTTVTAKQTSSSFITAVAFGISGANTSSPIDGSAVTGHPDPQSITTTFANDFIVGAYREGSTASPTAGATYTAVLGANFALTEYRIVSAINTYSVTQTAGATDANGGVVFAVKRSC